MLGKLIKHEFRALSRFLLPIHILLLVACLIGRFMFQAMATMDLPNVISIVSFVFLISIWIVVPCATSILIVVRYYKSLYTDEGYLTLTLPATRGQLLFSKAFAACVWSILDLAIVIAGYHRFIKTLQRRLMSWKKHWRCHQACFSGQLSESLLSDVLGMWHFTIFQYLSGSSFLRTECSERSLLTLQFQQFFLC